jgi:voltage-gated potassium channel
VNFKQRVWQLIETAEGDDLPSRVVDLFIIALIALSTAVVVLDSVPGLLSPFQSAVRAFEYFVLATFSVEYLVRLWACTADPRYSSPVRGRLHYATTPLALVDLAAILPFYLPWFLPRGLLFLRVLRLVRLLRLFKVGRYSAAPRLVLRALRRRSAELLAALFVLFLLLVSMASLLYLAENPGRPDLYSSIPESMWWSILALTGNGQVAPITLAGRLVASAIAIIGVGLFAVPAGLLSSAFTEELGGAPPDVGVGDPEVERVTERVVLAHLERRHLGGEGLAADYDEAALVITPSGPLRGPAGGVSAVSAMSDRAEGEWRLERRQVAGVVAVLAWAASGPDGELLRATETVVVREGLIHLQSIDY